MVGALVKYIRLPPHLVLSMSVDERVAHVYNDVQTWKWYYVSMMHFTYMCALE